METSGKPRFLIGRLWLLLLAAGLFAACNTQNPSQPPVAQATETPPAPVYTVAPLPTLLPTSTPVQNGRTEIVEATPTSRPSPQPTATQIDLQQPVVSFRYEIPAIGLDRRLEGTISSFAYLYDDAAGSEITLQSRGGLLLEIRQALSDVALDPLPDGCDRCVKLSYDLPLDGKSGSGWLQDPILMASIDHLLDSFLGPHFPTNTTMGLHRQASGYNVSHSVAILDDGTTWRWMATSAEIEPAQQADIGLINTQLDQLAINRLEQTYTADCAYYPVEILTLNATENQNTAQLEIKCAHLALPDTVSPLYAILDTYTQEMLSAEPNLPFPDPILPLDASIYFERIDGSTLTLYADGRLVAVDAAGAATEATVDPAELEVVVNDLAQNEFVPRGVSVVIAAEGDPDSETEEVILVRGELGVYELGWNEGIGQSLVQSIAVIDLLLLNYVGPIGEIVAPTATPEITAPITTTGTISITTPITTTDTITDTAAPETETETESP